MRRYGAIAAGVLALLACVAGMAWLTLAGGRTAPSPMAATLSPTEREARRAIELRGSGPAAAKNSSVSPELLPNRQSDRKPATGADPSVPPALPPASVASVAASAPPAGPQAAIELPPAELLARIQNGEPGMEVLASRIDLGTQAVTPRWREGDSWLVETYYRQMQATPETWSGPALWRFSIAREVGFRDRPCYEIVVEREGEDFPPSIAYVTRDTYRLAGLQTTVQEKGKLRTVIWTPSDAEVAEVGAVKAQLAIVPIDLPAAGAEARRTPAGLPDDRDPLPDGKGPNARMPRAADLVGAGTPSLDIEYENPHDGTRVRQRWSQEDMRWPVVSRTETTWSFRRNVK